MYLAQASTEGVHVDTIFAVLVGLSTLIAVGVFTTIIYFIWKYRRGAAANRSNPPAQNTRLEFLWITILLVLGLIMFTWAASQYFNMANPPANALEIFVVGKQWMWKFEHPEGQSEISDLHVPVGRAVKLTMISQDVIHSFFIPDFRVKQDVLPGRYTSLWFQATTPGNYNINCTQYCGTDHSEMGGRVIAMDPQAYQQWLAGSGQISAAQPVSFSLAEAGQKLFNASGCPACHTSNGAQQPVGPSLAGLYGSQVRLADGSNLTADESYLRNSILVPARQVVAGYKPIMPTYQGQLSEEQTLELIAYIKSQGAGQ